MESNFCCQQAGYGHVNVNIKSHYVSYFRQSYGDLGRRISDVSGDSCEGIFVSQRWSVAIQRYNAALFSETFSWHDDSHL